MKFCESCKDAIQNCIEQKTFALAHLYKSEKAMDIHIHDCYEIYYSISGGRQFLIDERIYEFEPGDIFFINQYESHYLKKIDSQTHERIVISVSPEYLQTHSTSNTDLTYCFKARPESIGHRISLSKTEQTSFLHQIGKLEDTSGFGSDILEETIFLQLMVFLTDCFFSHEKNSSAKAASPDDSALPKHTAQETQVNDILSYINQNIDTPLNLELLSSEFFVSTSYLCRIFKEKTGTTIGKYITAKRITLAKSLLASGVNVTDTCAQCGFSDYSNFIRTFTKTVGISPKKYGKLSL